MATLWNDPNCDPLADLAAVAKMIIEACQMCGGTTWIYEPVDWHPFLATVKKCPYCKGTGKLPQYRDFYPAPEGSPVAWW
jgi:hypothetical protein